MPKGLLQLAYKARSERFACGYYMNTLSSDKWIIVLYYECLYSGAGHPVWMQYWWTISSASAKCSLVDRLNELYCTMPLSISGLALLAQCTPIHTQFNVGYRYSGDPSLRTYAFVSQKNTWLCTLYFCNTDSIADEKKLLSHWTPGCIANQFKYQNCS